jgi:hypothetical protein
MWLYPVPIGIGPGRGGGACNRELPRIPLMSTSSTDELLSSLIIGSSSEDPG